jgi:hypothetical protein
MDYDLMSKKLNILLLGIVLSNTFLFGMGNKEQPAYRAIFSSKSPYYIADMTTTYRIKNVEAINDYLDNKDEFSREKFSERIVSLLEYNQILIQITAYLTNPAGNNGSAIAGHDIYFINKNEGRTVLSLGANINRQSELRFAKIIDNTLFIGLDEPYKQTNIVMVQLDKKEYTIKKYIPNLGIIENIWIQNNENLLYTAYNDDKRESGILKITENNALKLIEQFDYSILEYDISSNKMIGINTDGKLYYRDENKNSYVLNNIEGTVYKVFFLESNKIIICNFILKADHTANLLFGGTNKKYTHNSYLYYSLYCDDINISIKKINTIKREWCLMQIVQTSSGNRT